MTKELLCDSTSLSILRKNKLSASPQRFFLLFFIKQFLESKKYVKDFFLKKLYLKLDLFFFSSFRFWLENSLFSSTKVAGLLW